MEQKALFLDLDGTLLNDQKEITDGNREAINRALAAGHKVVITTGRPLVSAVLQAEKLGLDGEGCYVIAFNGGMIQDMGSGQLLHKTTIPLPLVYELVDEANRRNVHIQTYDDRYVLVEPRCDNESVRRYNSLIKVEHRVIDSVREMTAEPPKALVSNYHETECLVSYQEWIRANYSDVLDCFFSCDNYVEVVPKGTNKGAAVLQLAELLGIPQKNTIAAGDAANDLAMLRAAGLGVAMANGTDEAKAAAGYITQRDNNHDGIQEIIERFLFD